MGRFLRYSEDKLGVLNATSFESPLARKRYGPDILLRVPNLELSSAEVGIPPGDVIRLKEGSNQWWNMPTGGKRKTRSNSLEASNEAGPSTSRTRPQEFSYKLRYPNGSGGRRYRGGIMKQDETGLGYGDAIVEEGEFYYFSDAQNMMVPIPDGWLAPLPSDLENPFDM